MTRGASAIAFAVPCMLAGIARADTLPHDAAGEATDGARWSLYLALRNDVFTELDPPIDDQGFTHDNALALWRRDGDYRVGGSFLQRIITSRQDRQRWDLVELFARGERAWPELVSRGVRSITTSLRIGPTLAGNLGGRFIQDRFHALTGTGPTLDEGLQDTYDGDRRIGLVIGGGASASSGGWLRTYSVLDGQLALGQTGVTSLEGALGARADRAYIGAHAEIAATYYDVGDPNLELPGAYRPGWHFEWRLGVEVHWSRYRVGYTYRANESGSGEPMGVVDARIDW